MDEWLTDLWDISDEFMDTEGFRVSFYTCTCCGASVRGPSLGTHRDFHERKGDIPE